MYQYYNYFTVILYFRTTLSFRAYVFTDKRLINTGLYHYSILCTRYSIHIGKCTGFTFPPYPKPHCAATPTIFSPSTLDRFSGKIEDISLSLSFEFFSLISRKHLKIMTPPSGIPCGATPPVFHPSSSSLSQQTVAAYEYNCTVFFSINSVL